MICTTDSTILKFAHTADGHEIAAEIDPATGTVIRETWRDRETGKQDRKGGPAYIERASKTGRVIAEHWARDGVSHREDGPARINRTVRARVFYGDLWTLCEEWFISGKLHREDGPAYIERDPYTGVVVVERWAKCGNFHREDGPALIRRVADTGTIREARWFLDGREVTPS